MSSVQDQEDAAIAESTPPPEERDHDEADSEKMRPGEISDTEIDKRENETEGARRQAAPGQDVEDGETAAGLDTSAPDMKDDDVQDTVAEEETAARLDTRVPGSGDDEVDDTVAGDANATGKTRPGHGILPSGSGIVPGESSEETPAPRSHKRAQAFDTVTPETKSSRRVGGITLKKALFAGRPLLQDTATGHGFKSDYAVRLSKLVAREDYAGAAALQEEMQRARDAVPMSDGADAGLDSDITSELRRAIAQSVVEQDYSAAAALQRELRNVMAMKEEGRRKDDYEAKIAALIAVEDYQGAAVLKAQRRTPAAAHDADTVGTASTEGKSLDTVKTKIQSLVDAQDVAGADALPKQMLQQRNVVPTASFATRELGEEADQNREASHLLHEQEHQSQINALVAKRDYVGAALLQSKFEQEADKKQEAAHLLREQEHQTNINALLAKKDYAGAAALQSKFEQRAGTTNPMRARELVSSSADQKEEEAGRQTEHTCRLNALLADEDYEAAALLQEKTNARKSVVQVVQSRNGESVSCAAKAPPIVGRGSEGFHCTMAELYTPSGVLRARVRLEGVRLLSIGSQSTFFSDNQRPQGKGKGKGKGKALGKEKGKGKAGGPCQAVYFGDDNGYILCTLAYGVDVARMPSASAKMALVNVSGLCPRPGQLGVVYWTDDTKVAVQMESHDRTVPYVFPYDTTVSMHFATVQYAEECNIADYVDLCFYAMSVQVKYTSGKGEVFLEVYGVDSENTATGALRFWRLTDGDIEDGKIYIARGFKVSAGQSWDETEQKYVPRMDLPKKLECSPRTAIEDVTHVEEIAALFR